MNTLADAEEHYDMTDLTGVEHEGTGTELNCDISTCTAVNAVISTSAEVIFVSSAQAGGHAIARQNLTKAGLVPI